VPCAENSSGVKGFQEGERESGGIWGRRSLEESRGGLASKLDFLAHEMEEN